MSKTLDFYFDFASPTAYLAYRRLRQLAEVYPLIVDYQPMLLGGVFKSTGNTSPVAIPAKGKYMLEYDLPRFATRYQVPLEFNPHFPVNSLVLMRAAIAAKEMACFDDYAEAVFTAMWVEQKNMGDAGVVAEVLSAAGLAAEDILSRAADPDIKAALIASTDAAVERGVFGAPTLFMEGEMYFGQDRLDFVEQVLASNE